MTTTFGVASAGSTFVFQSQGEEISDICPPYTGAAAPQLQGFSLTAGDALDISTILQVANVSITTAELGDYFTTTISNGSTLLWFNPAGSGATPGNGAIVVAALENTQLSMSQLLAANALTIRAPVTTTTVVPLMQMGCTNNVITYRLEGHQTVCLQSPSHGVQQLAGFNAAVGDVIGLDNILEDTPVPYDLAGVGAYITSSVSAAGTTLYFDPTGQGLQGSAFAVLQGVDTTVAQLVADGGMGYGPDPLGTPPNFFAHGVKASILWQNTNGDVELWLPNSGSETFTGEDIGAVNPSWQIAGTGDFSGNGESSILWRNTNGDTVLWNPSRGGGFVSEDLGVVGNSWQIAGTGNFTGTGEDSILWRNTDGDTEVWNPNGSGGFVGQDLGVVNNSWQIAGTGDFTGTGEDSILWRNTDGDTALWNPNGSGGFVCQDLGVVGNSWQIAGTGDFTGTGEDSILWRNTNGDTELWNPNGSSGFVGQDLGVVGPSWQIVGTGNYSGIGQSGILWRNTDGDTDLWNANGRGRFSYEDLGAVSTSWSVQKIFA